MSDFPELQRHINQRQALLSWWDNRKKTDSRGGGPYKLRLSLRVDAVDFCGQSYVGANNYHGCPNLLLAAMEAHFQKKAEAAITQVVEEELQRLTQLILDRRPEVEAYFQSISTSLTPPSVPQ